MLDKENSISHKHKGYYNRGHLPHYDAPFLIQFITYRLQDSLPKPLVIALKSAREKDGLERYREKAHAHLDKGYGSCWLRRPEIAGLIQDNLRQFDGSRYRLIAWVVMPNHVHVVIETLPGQALPGIVHSWKSYTAHEANKLLERSGAFWQREYFDRLMRNEGHLAETIRYVHLNPVKAGLVKAAEDWPYSSAAGFELDWR